MYEKELWDAATEGDVRLVEEIITKAEDNIDINWRDSELKRTTFYRACGHGRKEVVEYLLTLPNIQVNLPTTEDFTPFSIAAQEGHVEVIKVLLKDSRVDGNRATTKGVTPFYLACQNGHIEVVKTLLKDDRIEINRGNKNDATPLFIASQDGRLDVVKVLLASGKVIDTEVKWRIENRTALDQAIFCSKKTVKWSWENQEDVERQIQNCASIAALLESYNKNRTDTVLRLQKELGILTKRASKIFSLVVLCCDNYYLLEGVNEALVQS